MMCRTVFILLAVLLMVPGISLAQMQGGMHSAGGQHMMMDPQMNENMGMMTNMMGEMHQMMGQGRMSPDQQKQMMDMMNRMGQMMQQMSGPEGAQMMEQQHKDLQAMQQQLDGMKGQMKKQ
jgi:hypothetical protein